MKIRLDLSRHCIETAARLKVERLIRSYFNHPSPDIEKRITGLNLFLEQTDFQDLRIRINRITDGHGGKGDAVAVLILSAPPAPMEIRFKNHSIYPTPRIW